MGVCRALFLLVLIAIPLVICDNEVDKLDDIEDGIHNHGGSRYSLVLGRRNRHDRVLLHQLLTVHSRHGQVVHRNISYPSHGRHSNERITCITVIDLKSRGRPLLTRGGVGKRSATINLQSQRGGALHYNVTIYGRR